MYCHCIKASTQKCKSKVSKRVICHVRNGNPDLSCAGVQICNYGNNYNSYGNKRHNCSIIHSNISLID